MDGSRPDDALDRRRLRRLAGGDPDALAEVYDAHAARLYGLALWLTGRRSDAEDIVQETMVKLAGMGGELLSVRRPCAYLLRMVRNAAFDRSESGGKPAGPSGEASAGGSFAGRPVRELRGGAQEADPVASIDLRAALSRLPAEQREVVFLHAIEGLTFREAGRVIGASTFTAASRYRLALKRLRTILADPVPGRALPELE